MKGYGRAIKFNREIMEKQEVIAEASGNKLFCESRFISKRLRRVKPMISLTPHWLHQILKSIT